MQGTSFNVWGQTRSSVKPRVRTYRIAGQVTDNFCGTGIKDVSVTLGGASTASALTDAYGNFSFPNLPEGNGYTITLAKSGYTFQPPNWSVSNLQFDSNFVSKTTVNPNPLPNIRGRVADATGKPIAGLKLNLDGYYYPRSEYTSGSGNYAFNCLEPALNYTITPVGASYTFTPPTQTFNNLTQTVAANFTSSPLPVTVSGHVIESGKPLKGLLVKLEGDRTAQMLTDDAGFYSFTIPADGLYSLTPSRDFYTFSPQNVSFSNLSGNQTYNFAGQKTTYSIEVYAKTPFDQSISGATVTLSGGATATTQTDASGYAVLRNLAPLGDYTVTVAKDGYTFDPPNKTWEFVFGDKGFIFRGTPPTTDGNCVTSLSPASAFAYFTGGSPSIHISAPTGCNWTATTSATWIRMPSGQSYGVGSRQFGVTAERNDSVSPRTGIVTIGGQTFTITQGGAKSETPNILWQSGGEAGGGKAVALSPDKQLLATSSEGTIKIWRYADGQLLKTFGALYTTTALQFTPDGQHLIAAGKWLPGQDPRTGTLRMYRVSDWQQERDFNPGATSGFNSFKFTPDGQYLVLGSETFTVQVLRVSDGARVGTFGPFNVRAVSVSPDGQYFAATGFDYWSQTPEARVWRMSDGALIKKLSGMTFISDSISYSPDGQYLAVGDWGGAGGRGTVWLWQTSDWTLARKFEGPFNSAVYTLAFSPDGLTLATAGSDAACTSCINQIYLWNVATGLPLGTIPALKGAVYQLLFSDNTTLYSRGAEHFAKVWQLPTGSLVRQFGTSRNWVTAASFSPDGQYIASTNAVDDDSTLWGAELRRASDGALVRTFLGHLDVINSLAFSPDGQTLATASGSASIDNRDSRIFLWDVGTGAQLRTLPGHGGGTTSLSYSSGGQLLASGGRDSLVKVWNPSSGTLLRSFTACDGNLAVNSIAFSPDGTLLATGGGDTRIRLWRTSDLTLVRTLAGNNYPVFSLAFSPDGQTLAVSSDSYGQHIQLWRTGDGALLRSFGATNAFSSHLAFSHDGRTLISSSTSMLWFWNVDDGDLLRTYGEDVGWTWPSALAVSPDGRQLGVGRYDQTIEVLNLPGVTVGDEIGPPGPGPVFFFLPPNPEPPPELETPPGRPIPQTQPPRPSAPTRRR
jgi:WD40 repeat protein